MPISTFDYVEITGLANSGAVDGTGTWNSSVPLGNFIALPSNATGVYLAFVNTSSSPRWMGVRTPGKVTAASQFDQGVNSGTLQWFPISTGGEIDLYCEENTTAKFLIVAISDETFFYNDIDEGYPEFAVGSGYAVATPEGGTSSGAVLLTCSLTFQWRPVGSVTTFVLGSGQAVVCLDASGQVEIRSTAAATVRIVATISQNITVAPWSPPTETPIADSAYHVSTLAVPVGALMAVVQSTKTSTSSVWFYRAVGSTYNKPTTWSGTAQEFFCVPVDAAGDFEYFVETGGTGDQYVTAWFTAAPATNVTGVNSGQPIQSAQNGVPVVGTLLENITAVRVVDSTGKIVDVFPSWTGSGTSGAFNAPNFLTAGLKFGGIDVEFDHP